MRADRFMGGVLLLFAMATLWFASELRILPSSSTIATTRSLPLAVGVIIALGALFLILRPSPRLLAETLAPVLRPQAVAFVALLFVYALTFRYVDFRFGVWLFMLASMALLGERRPWMLAIMPIACAAVIFLIFRYGFIVLVPTWI